MRADGWPSRCWDSRQLWGLWDMLKENADDFILLGTAIHDAQAIWRLDQNVEIDPVTKQASLTKEGRADLIGELRPLLAVAKKLELSVAVALLENRLSSGNLPQSDGEFNVLVDALRHELRSRLFLFVPSHAAKYYEWNGILSDAAKAAFPGAYGELLEAGNCFAAGVNTAAVFHSMRAAEIGLRALGTALGVTFPNHPIELAEWQPILEQAESKIAAMKALPKGTHKDEELNFYSQAAVQFRYFKDGWRVRVAHARATYSEGQAKEVIDRVRSFFESLAVRLKE